MTVILEKLGFHLSCTVFVHDLCSISIWYKFAILGYVGRRAKHDDKGRIYDRYDLLEGFAILLITLKKLGRIVLIAALIHDESSALHIKCSYNTYTLVER